MSSLYKLIESMGIKRFSMALDNAPSHTDKIKYTPQHAFEYFEGNYRWSISNNSWEIDADGRGKSDGVFSIYDIESAVNAWSVVYQYGGIDNALELLKSTRPKTILYDKLTKAITQCRQFINVNRDNIIKESEALQFLDNGMMVEYSTGDNVWHILKNDTCINDVQTKYRLFITPDLFEINGVELKRPFQPIIGDSGFVISGKSKNGYEYALINSDVDKPLLGMWKNEQDIKAVVQLLATEMKNGIVNQTV